MNAIRPKDLLKNSLGSLPYAADLYFLLRQSRPHTRYNLEQLAAHLPEAVAQVRPFAEKAPKGKRLLLFATLHYWVEQAVIIGLALRGLGHEVTVAYLPYADWRKPVNAFDLRRQDLYTQRVLAPAADLIQVVSLLDLKLGKDLPEGLVQEIETVSTYDAQYTLQVEEVDLESEIFRLRVQRNLEAARTALAWMEFQRPEVVLVPNGTITELGAVYRVARQLGLSTVTYEFNDQREQVWIAQDDEVMRQNTDALWAARSGQPLTKKQRETIGALEEARMGARAFGKSSRKWQDVASVGGEQIRHELGLDERPVALLATNVLGDSLTLGRNLFAASMADWIAGTVRFFAAKPEVQLLIRIHPGERLTHGPSMADVVKEALPEIPSHIHLIGPLEQVNTYDLMEITGLGLVYTTTTGLEMAMHGLPVMVCGQTHYRGRGFTCDPNSWDEYFAMLNQLLSDLPARHLTREQVELAWNYAYRFFFEYPQPFPWRLMHFWKDVDIWPLERLLSEGRVEFGKTFEHLAGEPLKW